MNRFPRWTLCLLLVCCTCGKDNGAKPPAADTVPPAVVGNLAGVLMGDGTVVLQWSAPGDDGASGRATLYDLRYARQPFSETSWDSASVVPSPPIPKPAGQAEVDTVRGLANGDWYFRLKAADEAANWSAPSNTANITIADTTPPGRVEDLEVESALATRVTLSWTVPGGNAPEEVAQVYDVRYATSMVSEATWASADRVAVPPAPGSPGSRDSLVVTGLQADQTYYFALKTGDDVGNWSELSNVSSIRTASVVRLTRSSGGLGASRAVWSPDGQSMAFAADWAHELHRQLYRMPVGGGTSVKLSSDPESAFDPTWSPDGSRIAFATWSGARGLMVMEATAGAVPQVLSSHGGAQVNGCTWSRASNRIAYSVLTSVTPFYEEIHTVSGDGGSPELLIGGPERYLYPAWSPDGTQIAFTSTRSGSWDIWVMPASGGDAARLTDDPGIESAPAWSPDGTKLAFVSQQEGDSGSNIWVMSSTGNSPIQITFDAASKGFPQWSPDGTRLSYHATIGDVSDLYILNLQ